MDGLRAQCRGAGAGCSCYPGWCLDDLAEAVETRSSVEGGAAVVSFLMTGGSWSAGAGFGEAKGPAVLVWCDSPCLDEVAPQGVGTAESAAGLHRGDGVVAAFEEACG